MEGAMRSMGFSLVCLGCAALSACVAAERADEGGGGDPSVDAPGDKADFGNDANILGYLRAGKSVQGEFKEERSIYGYLVGARTGATLSVSLQASAGTRAPAADTESDTPYDSSMGVYGPFEGRTHHGEEIGVSDDGESGVEAPPITFEVTETGYYLVAFAASQNPGTGRYRLSVSCEGTERQCLPPAGRSVTIGYALSNAETDPDIDRTLTRNAIRWTQRDQLLGVDPNVLIVRGARQTSEHPNELDTLQAFVGELGFEAESMLEPRGGLSDAHVHGYDVVWFTNPGHEVDGTTSVRTLQRFVQRGGGVILSGDDLAISAYGVGPLTHLEGTSNGVDTCAHRVTFGDRNHPLLRGLAGESFTYKDDLDHAVTLDEGETVFARATLDGANECEVDTPVVVGLDHSSGPSCDGVLDCNEGCSAALFSTMDEAYEFTSPDAYASDWNPRGGHRHPEPKVEKGALIFGPHEIDADWWHKYSPSRTHAMFGDVMVCARYSFTPTEGSDSTMETSVRGGSNGMVVGIHARADQITLKTRGGAPEWEWTHHAQAPLAFESGQTQDVQVLLYGQGDRYYAEVRNVATGETATLKTQQTGIPDKGPVGLLGWELEHELRARRVLIGTPAETVTTRLTQ
jgi:hypothetical protein